MVSSDEIRERYLSFFEEQGHRRLPSASLVPSSHDPSALLTVAGMHPLKPYFLGQESPPAPRLTSCQKCFRTVDIDHVGDTSRHLTFFEMLGNFSIGDYFKEQAIAYAWELSLEVFAFSAKDIWVTVFSGDEELGLGPDEEAIAFWEQVGVPRERIVPCPRSENFWQAGPTGPCGPCSELYLDRGEHLGPSELPGGEGERFLEYWNLVFMQYLQEPEGVLAPLPAANIDTGLGLNRMAAILQGKSSVFETDQFHPLIELGESLSGRRYGEDGPTDRALRILADHSRAMTFLIADGVVPSNEDRGYVLRRVMRRAILQGRTLSLEDGFLPRYAGVVRETMGGSYPELDRQRASIDRWLASEEASFSRTLEQGLAILAGHIAAARDAGRTTIDPEDAFKLHDTFGFPFELTRELAAEQGLSVEESSFNELMDVQRSRARAAASASGTSAHAGEHGTGGTRSRARALAAESTAPTRFTGYETEHQSTTVAALAPLEDRPGQHDAASRRGDAYPGPFPELLVKLEESPFYAVGGGQVSDVGVIESEAGEVRGRVRGVLRLGGDQVLEVALQRGTLAPQQPVVARVDHAARHATECNHTATHLLHAALRARLGDHVHQAGSYVGPDKLRFDFAHTAALSAQELSDVEDQVNAWIAANDPVHAITTTLAEARKLGAMALFGEKYGEVVRMVEVADGSYSRELCGGTHVKRTAEIGPFTITAETSSAANVRRIEALTGPAATELLRGRSRLLLETAAALRSAPDRVPEVVAAHEQERRKLRKAGRASGAGGEQDLDSLIAAAERVDGASILAAAVPAADGEALLPLLDRLKARLPDAAIVLGAAGEGRLHLIASVAPSLVHRGVKAGEVVKVAAALAGGGGGGRDTMARAGGGRPEKLSDAIAAARREIVSALAGGSDGE